MMISFPAVVQPQRELQGPLVIEAEIGGYAIHRMYVDGGSSMEVLYEHCFNRLRPEIKSQMVPATTSLTGFSGEIYVRFLPFTYTTSLGDLGSEKQASTIHGSWNAQVPSKWFLSKSAEKSLPLFKTLKKCVKKSDFRWTPEAEQAFKQLKQHISELPMLVAPRPKEELIMYLSTSQ
ncbi:hypothetical protein Tco_0549064 [Tanacetum coccineum]